MPYRWGGESRQGVDCSGLVRRGWGEFGVWPFDDLTTPVPQDRDATAHMIWEHCFKILWQARRPGDVVCFGENGRCRHVVGVLPGRQLIGANRGRAPFQGESADAYAVAMKARGARVKVTPASYWARKRLGVVRAPGLIEIDYAAPGHLKDR